MNTKKQIDDGGPAFPDPCNAHPGAHPPDCAKGMTLRDWFAGQALAGLAAHYGFSQLHKDSDSIYDIADAMIESRNNTKPCATP